MKLKIVLFCLAIWATGCSTMTPARYAVSVDNNQALKQYAGSQVKLASLDTAVEYNANCRLMGPIQAADGMTIPQFIEKAFNDELKTASLYSESGVILKGNLTKVAFSSSEGLTNGWWELGWTLTSSNGQTMAAENKYQFKSGFDAITACNQTAQALGAAVQDLIQKTVTSSQFVALLK